MFVGKKEKKLVNEFLTHKGAMMIYGLRRVGKTTLIKNVLDESKTKYVYFECQSTTGEENVKMFIEILKEQIDFTDARFSTFLSIFKELDKNYKNNVIVIDEYSYMKQYYLESKQSEFKNKALQLGSEFQSIIDNHLTSTNLILSGSSIHIMQQLNEYKSPFYGRLQPIINLHQLSYLEVYDLLNLKSKQDFISFYSAFGGNPYVLSKVNPNESLKSNICNLILNEDGALSNHIKNNVINGLLYNSDLNDILNVIKNGRKKYSDIESKCHITSNGLLDKRLKKLIELDIIEPIYPISKESDKRKKLYQIKDNLLKFYYSYVFRNENKINLLGANKFYEIFIYPTINQFIARRFENVVRDYFALLVQNNIRNDIIDIGTYFSPTSEFDCVLKKNDNTYAIYEAKYLIKPMTISEIGKEVSQISNIKGLKISEIGFICSSGFESKNDKYNYIDLPEIFKIKE